MSFPEHYKILSILWCIKICFVVGNYINCTGDHICEKQNVTCTPNEDCIIQCSGYVACDGATFECPSGYGCNITCTGEEACWGSVIQAALSTELYLLDCNGATSLSWTCDNIDIYCPPNQFGDPQCHIFGNDNGLANCGQCAVEPTGQNGLNFYATHGWLDMDFAGYTGTKYTDTEGTPGTMHCLNGYTASCAIGAGWTCSGNTDCDITANPTSTPTTSAPTTNEPITTININDTSIASNTDSSTVGLGVTITINFEYQFQSNQSANISIASIGNVLVDIIDTKAKNNSVCLQDNNYMVPKVEKNENMFSINATVLVCNEMDQILLITKLNSSLKTDFIDRASTQLHITIGNNIEVAIIPKDNEAVTSTTEINVTMNNSARDNSDGMTAIYVAVAVIAVSLIIILFICFIICHKRKMAQKVGNTANLEFVTTDNASPIDSNIGKDESEENSIERVYGEIDTDRGDQGGEIDNHDTMGNEGITKGMDNNDDNNMIEANPNTDDDESIDKMFEEHHDNDAITPTTKAYDVELMNGEM